jgi:hypothetical protein
LRDIDELLAAHAMRGGRRRGRRWNVAALNRSAIVLCAAHLEGFIEDLFSEALQFVLERRLNAAAVPLEIKLLPLRRLAASVRDAGRAERRERALRRLLTQAVSLGHPRRRLRPADVDLREVLWEFSSPTPSGIDRLFSYLGMHDVLGNVRWPRMRPDRIRQRLQNLVDRRNEIAHGTVGIRVGRGEVGYFREFLPRFSMFLDDAVRRHVAAFARADPWPPGVV